MNRHVILGIVLATAGCDDPPKPPPDDKQFHKLMENWRQDTKAVVQVYVCNRPEFGTHATDKNNHINEQGRDVVILRLQGSVFDSITIPPGSAKEDEVLAFFAEHTRLILRFPRQGNEEQLYRIVNLDADPGVPDQLLDRIEIALKKVGARKITRTPR